MHDCLIIPKFLPITAEQFLFNGKRGMAILVTCDYVGSSYSKTLEATATDADEMKKTFEQLQYNVHQLKNKEATKDAITTLVKKTSSHLYDYKGPLADVSEKVIVFAFSGCGTDKDNIDFIDANDGEYISLKEDVIIPLVSHPEVFEMPKLFFIDASRHNDGPRPPLMDYMVESFAEMEGNYRIDYAAIPNHDAYITSRESKWIPVLARELRKEEQSLQNIAAIVKCTVYENTKDSVHKQQSESLDRLNTGPLRLHSNKSS